MENSKINKILWFSILFLIVIWALYFWFKQFQIYLAENQVESINKILITDNLSRENCVEILDFDKTLISSDNKFFDVNKFDVFEKKCDFRFNIIHKEIDEDFCKQVIKSDENDFEKDFIILDDFSNIQNKCISEFLKVEFWTWSFFNIEQDFKSNFNISFSLDFYEDSWELNSEEFINNRIDAKKRLINLIEITPNVNINIDDIVLYKKEAIINLDLTPKTEYKVKLKPFNLNIWKEIKTNEFIINTPENKFFWFKINEKNSLFMWKMQPSFTFYWFNTDKKEANLKICRVENEAYSKIEVYDEFPDKDFRRNFFKDWIDKIETIDCMTKKINLLESNSWTWEIILDNNLLKKVFSFKDTIWEVAKNWLYYVTFENKNDREFNKKFQRPIFFWIINSHITMKLSASKEAFFFVNDFEWKPLYNQEIKVNLNNFVSQKRDYDRRLKEQVYTYMSPFENNVLSEEISLWRTNAKWILKVDLKWKIDDAFDRTFDSWNYNWDWNLNSLFVTASSKSNLSFVSSKYNWWITPWNFWYSMSNWWYGDRSENSDEIKLNSWWNEPEFYSHSFTDRKLYLPWEEVNIKLIVRKSSDLSIPRNKEFSLIVKDNKRTELLNKKVKTNLYGSISETIKLTSKAWLWNYSISLMYDWKLIWSSRFSVEIFKNPKFKTEIMIETEWLNWELVDITEEKIEKKYYYERTNYIWNFKLKARLNSKYYNWASLKNAWYEYKVYKQYYYDNSYWNDCYYGCYYEPNKNLYTEWKWVLDDNWISKIEVPIKFESSYSDYKYILEVTVKDSAWDVISSSNSIIAKLPSNYKKWDSTSGIKFSSDKRFYKSGEKIVVNWTLSHWKFTTHYNDKFLLIIKKKNYDVKTVKDVRWYERQVVSSKENIEKILLVNDKNFAITDEWKVFLNYIADSTWEYIFEFWKVNNKYFTDANKVINEFYDKLTSWEKLDDKSFLSKNIKEKIKVNYDNLETLINHCEIDDKNCDRKYILDLFWCKENYINSSCRDNEVEIDLNFKIRTSDLIDKGSRKYFSLISYWEEDSTNPVINDNKIQILSEKISYNIWDTARFLIRLPSSKWKILFTTEKQWVIDSEVIDIKNNTFFKEFKVTDKFVPNSYFGVVFIPEFDWISIPEYKVWYTEIVVDKTNKKSFIDIKSDKKVYKPRENVVLDFEVKDKFWKPVKSELTVMVIDDSLISLMWNVDLNVLEKFYKKLPFRIQTSITNIAMLKNYYFSRKWIVWWSWFGNFKWWDSKISSRTIFKNTAYYNANVLTNNAGKAQINFKLPDNLTNFRIIALWNSTKNLFWTSEEFIEVRKNVVVEDKTPLILRNWDVSTIGANVFNNTNETIWFKVQLDSEKIEIRNKIQNVFIGWWKTKFISWEVIIPENLEKIDYKILAYWNSSDNSDSIENSIDIKSSPLLIKENIKNYSIVWSSGQPVAKEFKIEIPENIDLKKSKVEINFSNNKLTWIEKIIGSLAKYPYGCIEQTISSTLPNAVVLKYSNIYPWVLKNTDSAKNNLTAWIERLKSMQLKSGWFAYWDRDTNEASLAINSYVLSSMLDMKKAYYSADLNDLIDKNIAYLEWNYEETVISNSDKLEVYFALSKAWKKYDYKPNVDSLKRYDLLKYTYWLYFNNKNLNKSIINSNVEKLKTLFETKNYSNRYYSNENNEKAIFAQLLLDISYDDEFVSNLIWEMYSKNWNNYYHSTKTKNNTFQAFNKFLQKHWTNIRSTFWFSIWKEFNRDVLFSAGWAKNSYKKFEYNISDLLFDWEENLDLLIANIWKGPLYVDVVIKEYPKDILKVGSYSNWISLKREVYEVLDEANLSKCTSYWYYRENKYSSEFKIKCDKTLKLVQNNTYKKWSLYMIKVTTDFDDNDLKNDFVIEDYLPWSFRIINSKFKTESALVTQNTKNKNWSWNYIEYRPNAVMAHERSVWWNKKELSYFVRADFAWLYTYPPVTWYMMYNPSIRWNSEFNIIEVK